MPDFAAGHAEQSVVMADSVMPIVEAGLNELVETHHRLTDEVSLFATPGHTPGHVSVAIRSRGKEAVITRDLIHSPIQLADPGICANFDFDPKIAYGTRQAFVNYHSDRNVLVLGTHFPSPAVGQIVRDVNGWRFAPTPPRPFDDDFDATG
jgi:glyoxylase-like metal-dependent hydrolase (beta-lactamase superfamily II)